MNEDTVLLEAAMGEKMGTAIFNISMFAAGLGVAFAFGWDLTLIMCAVLPLMAGSIGFLFKVTRAPRNAASAGLAVAAAAAVRYSSTCGLASAAAPD